MANGWVVTGPPVSCTGCSTSFRPSLVVAQVRKKPRSALCPRCLKKKKAERRNKVNP